MLVHAQVRCSVAQGWCTPLSCLCLSVSSGLPPLCSMDTSLSYDVSTMFNTFHVTMLWAFQQRKVRYLIDCSSLV